MGTDGRRNIVGRTLSRAFPEQWLFLRSDTQTRFVRLSCATQLTVLVGGALIVGWTIIASSILLMDSIGSGSVREQALREQIVYEERLNALSHERDAALAQTRAAHERFNAALAAVSAMQSDVLTAQTRRHELERGIDAVQTALRRTIGERDAALAALAVDEDDASATLTAEARAADAEGTLDILTAALRDTAAQRDAMAGEVTEAEDYAEEMLVQARRVADRNDRIFSQLEDALTISVAPLDKMFKAAGLSTDSLIASVRKGSSGTGGPLTPISFSTKGSDVADPDGDRANGILEKLDRMNAYRIAADRAPFALPVLGGFRYTSGFGPRWGRMHEGTDLAGPYGTPILATADGVVTWAGPQSGYGNLVKIRHDFGIETRYGHQSKIRVKVGQRVSRGDRIGDMGSTGRSTGNHLHYEVRVNGKAVNPMTYIKAGQDVF